MGLVKKITAKSRQSRVGREEQENRPSVCDTIVLGKCTCACASVYLCVCRCMRVHPPRQYRFANNTSSERLCLFENISLKWFLRDLSQQRGQEKSITPSLLPSSVLFPLLSSPFCSFTSCLYLHAPASSVLYFLSLFLVCVTPYCHSWSVLDGLICLGVVCDIPLCI